MRKQPLPNNDFVGLIRPIAGRLWQLVILDNTFRIGFYFTVISAFLILTAKIFDIPFPSHPYRLMIIPLVGLLVGFLIGLFRKPAMSQIALIIDDKLQSQHYFSTALECSLLPSMNPIEQTLTDNIKNDSAHLLSQFSFVYNWRHPLLFVILAGVMLIIWFTPVANSSAANQPNTRPLLPSDMANIITISQGLSELKNQPGNSSDTSELIRQFEELLRNIQTTPQNYALLKEKMEFIRTELSGSKLTLLESARLQLLMEQLRTLVDHLAAAGGINGNQNTGENVPPQTFSRYQPEQNTSIGTQSVPASYTGQTENIQINTPLKTYESAINNPYLPPKYKEIIKKYFQ